MPGLLSPFKAAGRGLNGLLNVGARNAVGGVGGNFDALGRGDRQAARSGLLMALGRGLQQGDIGGSVGAFQQGQMAPLLDFRDKQRAAAEQRIAQQQELARRQKLMQEAGYQGLAQDAIVRGDSAGANAAANASKTFAEAKPGIVSAKDYTQRKNPETGEMEVGIAREDGSFVPIEGAQFGDRYENVGGALWDKQKNEWLSPPQKSEHMNVNGVPKLVSPDGKIKNMDGSAFEGEVSSMAPLTASAEGAALQAFIAASGGDAKAGTDAYMKAKEKHEGVKGLNQLQLLQVDAGSMAGDAVIKGDMLLTDVIRQRLGSVAMSAFMQKLAGTGIDFATRAQQERAMAAHYRSQNSVGRQGIRNATDAVFHSIPLVRKYNRQLKEKLARSQFTPLNDLQLYAARKGLYDGETQQIVANLQRQIHDLQAEAAKMYKGGASAAEKDLELQMNSIESNWDFEGMESMLKNVEENAKVRKTIIMDTQAIMPDSMPWQEQQVQTWNPETGGFE